MIYRVPPEKFRVVKYIFEKTNILVKYVQFSKFVLEKMDFLERKNVAIFEKWIHFLIR